MSSLRPKVDCRPRFQNIFFKYFTEKLKWKLKLPLKFLKDHEDELSNPVLFKFSGTEWTMKLRRYKDEAWFDKDWKEFTEFYSFEYNDLLIFGYEGNSTFQVSLFDRPQKLIQSHKDDEVPPSPRPHIKTHSSGDQEEVQEEAPSVEISQMTTKAMNRSRSELKRKRNFPVERDDDEVEDINNSEIKKKQDFSGQKNSGNKSTTKRFQRTSEAMQRVKPEYPFFRIELLQNDNYGMILSLPFKFMRKHHITGSGEVTLQVSDGRVWKVELKCENSRAEFHDRWWDFIQDNELKVGDACVFMLIDNARLLFEVAIFHNDHTIKPVNCIFPTDIDEDSNDEEDSNENDQDNDPDAADGNTSFEIVIRPSYINHLWLPTKFSQKYLTSDTTSASLCVSGGKRTWPVKLKHYGQRAELMQLGWSKFVQDNNMKVGQVCKFLFNHTKGLSFEVVIEAGNTLGTDEDDDNSQNDDDEHEYSEFTESSQTSQHKRKRTGCNVPIEAHNNIKDVSRSSSTKQFMQRRPKVFRTKHLIREMGSDPAHHRAKAFKPGKPSFMVTMSPTYVHARYLHIPSGFAKEHLNEQPSKVTLRDPNMTTWLVKLHKPTRPIFRVGWWEFVRGNNLKVGDVCVFELIEESKFLFDVHFFRTT